MNLRTFIKPQPWGVWALILLMLATRAHSNHFGSAITLPDASLAVFFMAGLWYSGMGLFSVLLLEAALIDYVAISQMGVSDYCISPAYVFLIPTYAALFWGGRLAARFDAIKFTAMFTQLAILISASSVAFLVSNLSFYALSGRFADLNWLQYFERITQYYPSYMSAALIYALLIVGIVKLLLAAGLTQAHTHTAN